MPLLKKIEVKVDPDSWPALSDVPAELTALQASSPLQVDVLSALLFTAIWTRPPTQFGFSLSDCWAWLRYFPAIAKQERLKLCSAWTTLDPHHKTILSQDFGVGFSTWLLHGALRFVHYADTLHVVNVLSPGVFYLKRTKKKGPSKSPDYIATDAVGNFSVLECKGTQASRDALRDALKRGVPQKEGLRKIGKTKFKHSLVAGLFIPQWPSGERALFSICDPDWVDVKERLGRFTPNQIGRSLMQVSTAKELALLELSNAANTLSRAIEGRNDLREAIRLDLRRDRPVQPRVTTEQVSIQHEYRWSEPATLHEGVTSSGIRFSAALSMEQLEAITNRTNPAELGEERWANRTTERWASRQTDRSVHMTSPLGVRYELTLL